MSPLSNEWEQTFSDVSCRKNKQTEHERKCDECLLGGPDFFFKIKINKNNVKQIQLKKKTLQRNFPTNSIDPFSFSPLIFSFFHCLIASEKESYRNHFQTGVFFRVKKSSFCFIIFSLVCIGMKRVEMERNEYCRSN